MNLYRRLRRWYWRHIKWPLVGPKRVVGDGFTDDTEAIQFVVDNRTTPHG